MYYIFLLVTLVITLSSQAYIKSVYNKTRKIKANSGMTGEEVALRILDVNGLNNVKVVEIDGELSDHYDPKNKVVRLSSDVFKNNSIAAISVAAHECGHAIQDKNNYFFLRFRSLIFPLVSFASRIGYVIIIISIFAQLIELLWVGILFECIILLFQLITLPVEFNASSRALRQIQDLGIVSVEENKNCRKIKGSSTYLCCFCCNSNNRNIKTCIDRKRKRLERVIKWLK